MKKIRTQLFRFSLILAAALIQLSTIATPAVLALAPAQKQIFDSGARMFNVEQNKSICQVSSIAGGPVTQLTGDSNKAKIFNYLVQRGLTEIQAAGLMGNMQKESGFVPDRQQGADVSNPGNWPGGGWGIVQWTGSRRTAIVQAMNEKGIGDLYKQEYANSHTPADKVDTLLLFELDYLWQEFQTTHKTSYDGLVAAQNIRDATDVILVRFEHPFNPELKWEGHQSDPRWIKEMADRQPAAEAVLAELGGGAGGATVAGAGSVTKTVIALDPGHGSDIPQYVDTVSGLADRETNNMPEGDDVLAVAQRVKAELEAAGYEVVMLRSASGEAVNKRARVDKAVTAKASLTVSLHTTPGAMNDVWPQRTGTYREYNGKRVTITNDAVAKLSQTYANNIAAARETAEGHSISLDTDNSHQLGSFGRDDVPSKGNVSLVQLWGQDVPWVYNEIGQDNGTALSDTIKQKYADGLIAGIKKSVPAAGTGSTGCSTSTTSNGSLSAKTLEYAWPDYRGAGYTTPKPEWLTAFTKARGEGRYVGGIDFVGIDCGGFTTNLVVDSGFDPNFNFGGVLAKGAGNTTVQYDWLKANWQSLGMGNTVDPATLQPGDVAIKLGHTFIYVGDIPGFGSKIASASLDDRAPMADTSQSPTSPAFEWFRKR